MMEAVLLHHNMCNFKGGWLRIKVSLQVTRAGNRYRGRWGMTESDRSD